MPHPTAADGAADDGGADDGGGGGGGVVDDELTVFQAAPLVWKDEDGVLHAIDMLDFDKERETLRDSVESAESMGSTIRLVFETATTARLARFLGTRDTQVLHFSCHGLPNNLCFEDGWGGVQFLRDDKLRNLMSAGRGELRFVFVSACFSRAAGEAFVQAGVPHVVCCQQDEPLLDDAAVTFTSSFYSALSAGRTLLESFQLGQQAVKVAPSVSQRSEAKKFLLLPETSDHDVPVFYNQPRQHFVQPRLDRDHAWILPRPPDRFMFREMEMYHILQSLQRSRLVKLTGPPGIGKHSLAAAVCRYINDRSQTFPFREVVWLPLMPLPRTDDISESMNLIFDMVHKSDPANEFRRCTAYARACGTVIEALHLTKALFVIDTKDFQQPLEIEKLSVFICDLFKGIRDLKMILITRHGLETSFDRCCAEITEVALQPMGLKETATLFGTKCPFVADRRCDKVCTPRDLSRLLVPESQEVLKAGSKELLKRSADIFKIIGEGLPAQIHTAAMAMTAEEYDVLIQIGERKECNAAFATRFELEQQLSKLHEEKERAVKCKDFSKAQEVKDSYEELKQHRESFPDLSYLYKQVWSLKELQAIALSQEDFRRAGKLEKEVSLVAEQITFEEKAQDSAGLLLPVVTYTSRARESRTKPSFSIGRRRSKRKPFAIVISRGSIVNFKYPVNPDKCAIVAATNEFCVDAGGVDRAIASAGGPALKQQRESLKVIGCGSNGIEIRCRTGKAKVSAPGSYGTLHVPFVIFAVGPNYTAISSVSEGDKQLRSAYLESLARAKDLKLEAVAFSLISGGYFSGNESLNKIIRIGVEAICDFSGYDELREVHMCAFDSDQCNILIEAAKKLELAEHVQSSREGMYQGAIDGS